jgi:glycosyltransferase GT-like protein
MSPLLIALVLSLLLVATLFAAVVVLLSKNDRKNKMLARNKKITRSIRKAASKAVAKSSREARKTQKSLARTFRIFNDLIVKEVHTGSHEQLNKIVSALSAQEIRNVRRTTIMGITRLLIEKGRPEAAVGLLGKYIQPKRSDRRLYFLEPLLELDKLGLVEGDLHDFCVRFESSPGNRALEYLTETYDEVDEADRRNFQQLIIEPLTALTRDKRNLMDIRFSPEQRQRLVACIKESMAEAKPLSLLRLGDGEAYAFPPVPMEGFPPSVFEEDDVSFELNWWNARPKAQVRDDLVARVRQAVARCDILGFPSVYRIIRDLPPPHRRFGDLRNQRAFARLLGALGVTIPLNGRLLTEERCHRIKGAIDAPLLLELAKMAKSVVLVSSWSQLSLKFPSSVTVETIPVPAEEASVKVFETYPEIIDRIRGASKPGTLVVVGAGIVGKIFVDEARLCGAVALDVGSLLDYMNNRKTRTIADII